MRNGAPLFDFAPFNAELLQYTSEYYSNIEIQKDITGAVF